MSRPRADVLSDSGSSVLHGQLLHSGGATAALYFYSKKWLASWPQRLHTRIQNYCATRGDYRLQCTVHTCVQFLDWYVEYLWLPLLFIDLWVSGKWMFCDLSIFVFEEEVGVLCRNVTGIPPPPYTHNTGDNTLGTPGIILEKWGEVKRKRKGKKIDQHALLCLRDNFTVQRLVLQACSSSHRPL